MVPNRTQLYTLWTERQNPGCFWHVFRNLPARHPAGGIHGESTIYVLLCHHQTWNSWCRSTSGLKTETPFSLPNSFSESLLNANLAA